MRMLQTLFALAGVALLAGAAGGGTPLAVGIEAIDEQVVAIRHTPAMLRWQTIPWYLDLNKGIRAARKENRPILLWVAGDEPLGRCGAYADGLRAGPLSDVRVVEKICRNFVPVAVNLCKVRERKDEAGDFFRSAMKQKKQDQGIWVVAPDGKVLAGFMGYQNVKTWTEEVLAAVDEAVKKAGPLTERRYEAKDVLPTWGKGVQPDGSVTLALSMRSCHNGKGIGEGAVDAATLAPNEWQEFAPPAAEAGKSWRLSKAVACQFSRCLSIRSDQANMPLPHEVTGAEIIGSVAKIKDGLATLTYTGHIAAVHRHTFKKDKTNRANARMHGYAVYDVDKREMVSLAWVFEGSYRDFPPHDRDDRPLAAVVEWHRDGKTARLDTSER